MTIEKIQRAIKLYTGDQYAGYSVNDIDGDFSLENWESELPKPTKKVLKDLLKNVDDDDLKASLKAKKSKEITEIFNTDDKLEAVIEQLNTIQKAIFDGDFSEVKDMYKKIKAIRDK